MSEAVTGEKDGMSDPRANGSEEMNLQGVDYGEGCLTYLFKGLQEAIAKIEILEAKVTKLEEDK